MDIKNQLMALASMNNLNYLIRFHNNVRDLFKGQFQEVEKLNAENREKNRLKNILHDYDRILHINTFLMMYSYLEEWLYHCWKVYAPNVKLDKKKGSIGRFKNIIKQLGVDVSSNHWQILMDAEEIRNCLLHANGRINLFKNPQEIRDIINKKNSRLIIEKDRVIISSEYLQKFNENISHVMDIINKSHTLI